LFNDSSHIYSGCLRVNFLNNNLEVIALRFSLPAFWNVIFFLQMAIHQSMKKYFTSFSLQEMSGNTSLNRGAYIKAGM